MKKGRVLVTGGAGFIGSHTADELLRQGYEIRILDNLSPKTHTGKWPEYLNSSFEKIKGDVRDKKTLEKALTGIDYVIHLAAVMDLMPDYSTFFDTNVTPTALIYEIIVAKKLKIKKVIVASSQFVYGEGRWKCQKHGQVFPKLRTVQMMRQGQFDPKCPTGGEDMTPLLSEESHQDPSNQYAISKYTQELIALKLGRLNNIPSVAMRYCIVHGPRQSLKNVYSGALRIFTLKMLANQNPPIFEDGLSRRDYVSVYDVARANALVLQSESANYQNFNVGSGKSYTVLELAKLIRDIFGKDEAAHNLTVGASSLDRTSSDFGKPTTLKSGFYRDKIKLEPCGQFRVGDIRHAVSDITKLKKIGWRVKDSEEKVIEEYIDWVKMQKLDRDYLTLAKSQMEKSGILRKVHGV